MYIDETMRCNTIRYCCHAAHLDARPRPEAETSDDLSVRDPRPENHVYKGPNRAP